MRQELSNTLNKGLMLLDRFESALLSTDDLSAMYAALTSIEAVAKTLKEEVENEIKRIS